MTEVILDALRVAAEYMQHQTRCPQSHSPQKSSVCDCGYREAESAITTAIAAREAEGWQPIETAPDNELIECYSPGNPNAVMGYPRKPYKANDCRSKNNTFYDRWGEEWPEAPYTHWRPLPPPPEPAP